MGEKVILLGDSTPTEVEPEIILTVGEHEAKLENHEEDISEVEGKVEEVEEKVEEVLTVNAEMFNSISKQLLDLAILVARIDEDVTDLDVRISEKEKIKEEEIELPAEETILEPLQEVKEEKSWNPIYSR